MSADDPRAAIEAAFLERFGTPVTVPAECAGQDALARIAAHRVHREWSERPVSDELLRMICACALSAPSKSDLQQRDVVVVDDPRARAEIAAALPHMPWVAKAPRFLVFLANAARLPRMSALRGKPFPNDHLDLFHNAVGDAAIALATGLVAAEAAGLGAVPISEVRNHGALMDRLLGLPDRVIAFAGLCIGWPAKAGQISPRLPLSLTLHRDRFGDAGFEQELAAYDRRREALQPFAAQYQPERWGQLPEYGWSEQKARQYAVPQRVDFGAYVRGKRFVLD